MTDEQPLTLSEPRARWKHSWSHREGDPRWDLTVPKFPFSTPAFIPQASHSSDFTQFLPQLPSLQIWQEQRVWCGCPQCQASPGTRSPGQVVSLEMSKESPEGPLHQTLSVR